MKTFWPNLDDPWPTLQEVTWRENLWNRVVRRSRLSHRLEVVEEYGKRDSVVETRRRMTAEWSSEDTRRGRVEDVKRVLEVKIEAVSEIVHRGIDRFVLLGSPLEVGRGTYDLSPTTNPSPELE